MPAQEVAPEFRPVMSAYYDALDALGMRLMRLLGMTLNLPAEFFTDRMDKHLGTLRPIHYSGRVSQPDDVRPPAVPACVTSTSPSRIPPAYIATEAYEPVLSAHALAAAHPHAHM